MIRFTFLFLLLIFTSCSFVKETNEWEKRSSSNMNSYVDAYLSSKELMAKSSLSRAIKNAKQSSDLKSLARIYLSECALNIAVGGEYECKKYLHVKELVESRELESYHQLLTQSLIEKNIIYLPQQYQNFASKYLEKDYDRAIEELLDMKETTSTLICAALIRDKLDDTQRAAILQRASLYGYKKAILFWLKESTKYAKTTHQREKIEKKISILKSDE